MVRSPRLAVLLTSLLFTACATAPGSSPEAEGNNDPLEGFNRAIFSFNDKADRYVLKPVAEGYHAVLPDPAREGVSNFFSNLHDPVIMVNNLLQGKVENAITDMGRFLINSTFGLFGLIDIASQANLPKHKEDFGQTLAVWGVGEGSYLVLPILGPSTIRDGVGLIPDWKAYPTNEIDKAGTRYALTALEVVSTRDQLLEASDILEQAGGQDPYVFLREAYRQQRINQVYDGNPPTTQPDPSLFEDDLPPAPSAQPEKK